MSVAGEVGAVTAATEMDTLPVTPAEPQVSVPVTVGVAVSVLAACIVAGINASPSSTANLLEEGILNIENLIS